MAQRFRVLIVSLTLCGSASAEVLHQSPEGYAFTVPDGFHAMAPARLHLIQTQIATVEANSPVTMPPLRLEAGFVRDGAADNGAPAFWIGAREAPRRMPIRTIEGTWLPNLTLTSLLQFTHDRQTLRYAAAGRKVTNGVKMRVYGHVGATRVVELVCITPVADFDADEPLFRHIAESIHFLSGHEYVPTPAELTAADVKYHSKQGFEFAVPPGYRAVNAEGMRHVQQKMEAVVTQAAAATGTTGATRRWTACS
jgi:hypothetical protein